MPITDAKGVSKDCSLGLGIDTGGTFTDGVVVDLTNQKVLAKAKKPTTYHDLSIGIRNAVSEVLKIGSFRHADIGLVGISTTIATNSVLQGRGGRVGLIGIGWKPQDNWKLGCDISRFIKGGHDSVGNQNEPLDEDALESAITEMQHHVDAVVVSSIFSICNPAHEIRAKEIIRKHTDIPVVLSHVLTGDLGIYERTVTALLNAKLIPIMRQFMSSVEKSLRDLDLAARIMVFKGDGGLMSLEMAQERPIETILSGPAASLMGGKVLGHVEDCIVVDIGGTSTDIAFMERGFPRLTQEGAVVGGWRTRVKAIDIWTCGLGGDSIIWLNDDGEICIGPERVVPLAIAALSSNRFKERMKKYSDTGFYVSASEDFSGLKENEARILRFLNEVGPSALFEIMDGVPEVVLTRDVLNNLKQRGRVLQTGITPTDIMHVAGLYQVGDVEAAEIGVDFIANKTDLSRDQFVTKVLERMATRVGEEIIRKIIFDEIGTSAGSKALTYVLQACTGEKRFRNLDLKATFDRPIVAIGAPARIFAEPLAKRINAEVIVPEHHDVGNAVGAVCSRVTESVTVHIYPKDCKFLVFAPGTTPIDYMHVEEALAAAKSYAGRFVRERVESAGVEGEIQVKFDVSERRFCDGYGKEMKFINWIDVRATAMGIPKLY
ncbi:MAG: hydantoinase/oxoprolinase family protein [Methanomassiliicoccales archaeon]|jgi:N-methylhydantoinase A/oxoprolinase/acetone carboxylase beta subunit|nr:hydantoinase/oxoprolinase family protein [Methanomassiliicoccales archaeon]